MKLLYTHALLCQIVEVTNTSNELNKKTKQKMGSNLPKAYTSCSLILTPHKQQFYSSLGEY